MQIVAVTDANIFIDLIQTDMLLALFKLDLKIYTTQEVVDELEPSQQETIFALSSEGNISVYNLSDDELSNLSSKDFPEGLHIADRSVFLLTKNVGGIMLSGDKKLRNFSERNGISVRGILWIYDEVYSKKLMKTDLLVERIKKLMSINKRLPIHDCEERIRKWQSPL